MTAAGTPPDASRGPGFNSRQLGKNGMFFDIMPLAKEQKYPFDQHFDAAFPAHLKTPDGKLNGLPVGLLTMLRYVNLELFEKAGLQPPKDWAEGNWTQQQTFDNMKKLAQGEGTDRTFGLGLVIGGTAMHGAHWFWANGANLLDQQGEVKIAEPAAIETLELVNEFYKAKLAPFYPADTPGLSTASVPLFTSGKLGMIDVTQASAPNIAKAAKFKWRMGPLATGKSGKAFSVQFVDYWYVHAKTKSPEAAYGAIEVLNRPEFEEAMAEGKTGGIPTLKGVADKYATELGIGDADKVSLRALQGGFSQEPYYAVNHSEWVSMLNKKLDMLFLGQISAKECADQVVAESKPILAPDKA
jgi:multiple sugar transport system substrate-binding protein